MGLVANSAHRANILWNKLNHLVYFVLPYFQNRLSGTKISTKQDKHSSTSPKHPPQTAGPSSRVLDHTDYDEETSYSGWCAKLAVGSKQLGQKKARCMLFRSAKWLTTAPLERKDCKKYSEFIQHLKQGNTKGILHLANEKALKAGEKSCREDIIELLMTAALVIDEEIQPPIQHARPTFEAGLFGHLVEQGNDAAKMVELGGRWPVKKEMEEEQSEDLRGGDKTIATINVGDNTVGRNR